MLGRPASRPEVRKKVSGTLKSRVTDPEFKVPDTFLSEPVEVLGLPCAPLAMAGVIGFVDRMIAERTPGYVITANLNYAMLTRAHARLAEANRGAAMVVADGMPLIWASRLGRRPLPERVTGADLVPRLCARAAEAGHRVFFLGGGDGVAACAAERLAARFPGLQVAGVESPPFRELTEAENLALIARVREARPDILFVASSQPKGELWCHDNYRALGVPAVLQVGAAIDFAAGRVARAPRWVGRVGLEWAFRLALEPRRLGSRYARNVGFLLAEAVRGMARFSPKPAGARVSH